MTIHPDTPRPTRRRALIVASALALLAGAGANAQGLNRQSVGLDAQLEGGPVYLNDDPAATETLSRLADLFAADPAEAVREAQRVLETDQGRFLTEPDDLGVYRTVRERAHRVVLRTPGLLERYRSTMTPEATRLVRDNRFAEVESQAFLTTPGYIATLALAAEDLESARFDAARRRLETLTNHPDAREQRLAARALSLAETLAAYAPGASTARLLDALGERAARAPEPAEPLRPPLEIRQADPIRPSANGPGESFPVEPMWTSSIEGDALRADADWTPDDVLPAYPAFVNDLAVVNLGGAVRAWDRYTLELVWSYEPTSAGRVSARGRSIPPDDAHAVTATHLGLVCELTGEGQPRVVLLDTETGEPVWDRRLAALGDSLQEASVVGPPIVAGDAVLLVLDVSERLRRLRSGRVVALDLATGVVRWDRTIASAGAGRRRTDRVVVTAPVLHEGVLYVLDNRGVFAAIEAHSGRSLWARKLVSDDELNPALRSSPIAQPNVVYVETEPPVVACLTPDRAALVSFDPVTGAKLDALSFDDATPPAYLIARGDELCLVERSAVATVQARGFSSIPPEELFRLDSVPIEGRVQLLGDVLAVPAGDGLYLVDATSGAVEKRALRFAGNALVDQGQVLVVGQERLHTYLAWPTADRQLSSRITQNPTDTDLVITFVQLAFRAGAYDRVPGAIDLAIDTLEQTGRPESTRQRLFQAMLSMADPPARNADDPERATLTTPLIERMTRVERTPEERVATRLVAAEALADNDPAQAAAKLQEVLSDGSLADARYRAGRTRVRAGLVATQRLGAIVAEHGPGAYERFASQAEQELEAILARDRDARALADLARRYPVAPAAKRAWLAAADVHAANADADAELAALESGLSVVWNGRARSDATDAEIVGRYVDAAVRSDRPFAAARALARLVEARPDVRPTVAGVAFDARDRLEQLRLGLAQHSRKPRLGETLLTEAQAITGWRIVHPLAPSPSGGPPAHVMLLSRAAGLIALWAPQSAEDGASPELRAVWSRPAGGRDPRLLTLDPEAAYFLRTEDQGPTVERIDTLTGETVWTGEAFYNVLGNPPAGAPRQILDTALDGAVRSTDVLVLLDAATIALVERTGRAIAFDRATGRTLWSSDDRTVIPHTAALDGGALVLAGPASSGDDAEAKRENDPPAYAVTIRDARTGDRHATIDDLTSAPRWVRITPEGRAILATDTGVGAYDLRTAAPQWINDDPALRFTADAWVQPGPQGRGASVIVLGPDRQLWRVDATTGALDDVPMPDAGRVRGAGSVRASTGDDGTITFLTSYGAVTFDDEGNATGRDALRVTLVRPVAAEGRVVTVTESADATPTIAMLDAKSLALQASVPIELGADPDRIALLDGKILLTAGATTLVYSTTPPVATPTTSGVGSSAGAGVPDANGPATSGEKSVPDAAVQPKSPPTGESER